MQVKIFKWPDLVHQLEIGLTEIMNRIGEFVFRFSPIDQVDFQFVHNIVTKLIFSDRVRQTFTNLADDSLQDILFLVFVVVAAIISILTFIKNFSLIPILGVLFCSYLLIEIPAISWIWFFVWMALGLIIYFMYGYRKSKLREG